MQKHRFKVGDTVRCISPDNVTVFKRQLYRIDRLTRLGDSPAYFLEGGKSPFGLLQFRFELADNGASLTDQELADRFRAHREEMLECREHLEKRGYVFYLQDALTRLSFVAHADKVIIRKQVREHVDL